MSVKQVTFEELMQTGEVRTEMATMCDFRDGYGIRVEVNSDDHGTLDYHRIIPSDKQPAHAHIYLPKGNNKKGEFVGRLNITGPLPEGPNDIHEYIQGKKDPMFTSEIIRNIYDWAIDKPKDTANIEIPNNWEKVRYQWFIFNQYK